MIELFYRALHWLLRLAIIPLLLWASVGCTSTSPNRAAVAAGDTLLLMGLALIGLAVYTAIATRR